MISPINQLANLCSNGGYLTPQLISSIDELTHSYGTKFQCDRASLCSESWKVIENSIQFWENTFLLLKDTQYNETKLQALVLIHNRVKRNWYFESADVRNSVKGHLCTEAQTYNIGQMTKTRKSVYRKINHIIVQILKYQWMGDWCNFLAEICEAVEANHELAQNYFDLLSVIFQQIFSEKDRVISEQAKRITEQVIGNYSKIQKAFEKYLIPECPSNILKNAMIALQSLIQWIPPYYIFFGLLIDKLKILLANEKNQKEILNCLLTILLLPNDQILEQYIAKVYIKKRQILYEILSSQRLKKNAQTSGITLLTSYKLLQLQQNDIKKYGEKLILPDNYALEDYHKLLLKIVEWTTEKGSGKEQEYILGLYKYITTIGGQQIFPNIVDLTPCPFDTSFFLQKPIFKTQYQSSEQLVQDRANFTQMMKNLITNHEQQYYLFISAQLNDDFTRSRSKTKRLWKIIWNIYYFIEIATNTKTLKHKIFSIIAKLLQFSQLTFEKARLVQDQRLITGLLLCINSFQLGAALIYGNRKSIKNLQVSLFIKYLTDKLVQDNSFVKALLDILCISYNDLSLQNKQQIHSQYLLKMRDRKNRIQIDLKYIVIIGKWVSAKSQDFRVGVKMIKNLLQFYQKNVENLRKPSRNNLSRQKAEKIYQLVIKQLTQFLKLCIAVLPFIKGQLIFQIFHTVSIIRQSITKSEVTQYTQSYLQYFQLATKIFIASFKQLSVAQINNNIGPIMAQHTAISEYFFQLLPNKELCQEIQQSILDYLGNFIISTPKWNYDINQKYKVVTNIIQRVLNSNYSFDVPGYTQFLNKVVRCSIIPFLDSSIIASALNKTFILATFQSEQKTYKALQILKNLLTESISSTSGQNLLFNFIVECITITYILLIKTKSKEQEYVNQFSQVLYMSLVYLKTMKGKLVQNPNVSNLDQIFMILKSETRKQYPNYQEFFLIRVDQLIQHILSLNSKQQFKEKAKDLVIILRRGY